MQPYMDRYENDGYFIVDDAVDHDLLASLTAAAQRVRKAVRSGRIDVYSHRTQSSEPWCIRGLLSPDFNEPIFGQYLICAEVMKYVRAFLGEDLELVGIHLFTSPQNADMTGSWHRDFQAADMDAPPQRELAILNRPMTGLKWHLALVDDA